MSDFSERRKFKRLHRSQLQWKINLFKPLMVVLTLRNPFCFSIVSSNIFSLFESVCGGH